MESCFILRSSYIVILLFLLFLLLHLLLLFLLLLVRLRLLLFVFPFFLSLFYFFSHLMLWCRSVVHVHVDSAGRTTFSLTGVVIIESFPVQKANSVRWHLKVIDVDIDVVTRGNERIPPWCARSSDQSRRRLISIYTVSTAIDFLFEVLFCEKKLCLFEMIEL